MSGYESDTCGRSYTIRIRYVWTQIFLYPHKKICGYKNLRIRVDGASVECFRDDSFFLKVSKDNSIRIADVGVAKALVDTVKGTVTGTCVYMAPEVLHGFEYNSKADIYSLGIMLWEMWYGKEATLRDVDLGITSLEQFRKLVVDGCRPEHLEGSKEPPSTRWKNVVTQCWKGNPEDRPTAAVCATEMQMEQMELDEAVSSISIGYEELEWKECVPSSFADRVVGHVFQGIVKQKDHAQTAVTLKLCREGFEAINAKEAVKLMKQLR